MTASRRLGAGDAFIVNRMVGRRELEYAFYDGLIISIDLGNSNEVDKYRN